MLRRNVFKILYKFASISLTKEVFIKDLTKDGKKKLLFLSPVWITPNLFVIFIGFYNVEALERNETVKRVGALFEGEELKEMNLTYILYDNRVSSLLMNLPCDIYLKENNIVNDKRQRKSSGSSFKSLSKKRASIEKENLEKQIPNYLYKGTYMSIFNFIPYKSIRQANCFCKKWIWIKDNNKIVQDFIHILSRYRLWEGFELVHTCNDDLLFIKIFKLEKHNSNEEERIYECTAQYLIRHDKKNPTWIKTELYLEKESGFYSIKQK